MHPSMISDDGSEFHRYITPKEFLKMKHNNIYSSVRKLGLVPAIEESETQHQPYVCDEAERATIQRSASSPSKPELYNQANIYHEAEEVRSSGGEEERIKKLWNIVPSVDHSGCLCSYRTYSLWNNSRLEHLITKSDLKCHNARTSTGGQSQLYSVGAGPTGKTSRVGSPLRHAMKQVTYQDS